MTVILDIEKQREEIIENLLTYSIFSRLSNLDRNFILKNHLQHNLIPFGIQAKKKSCGKLDLTPIKKPKITLLTKVILGFYSIDWFCTLKQLFELACESN
jgi:hypothetical protein